MINKSHNSPWNLGHSDGFYSRKRQPCKYVPHPTPSVQGQMLRVFDLTPQELAEYDAGYAQGQDDGPFDWKYSFRNSL